MSGKFFTGKVIVVTGASSGIGAELARQLAPLPVTIALLSRSREGLSSVVDSIPSPKAKFLIKPCDVQNGDSVKEVIKAVVSDAGGIDILINNAGIGQFGPVDGTTFTELAQVISTNVTGVLAVTREVIPVMKKNRSGVIVNISSVASYHGQPHLIAYSASKAAVYSISEGLRVELHPFGIQVLDVQPGVIDNTFHRHALGAKTHVYRQRQIKGVSEASLVTAILRATASGRRELVFPWYWALYKIIDRLYPRLIELAVIRFMLPTLKK